MPSSSPPPPLSAADFHLLLVLTDADLYGYAILQAIERESRGALSPDLGALYRALARLVSAGYVQTTSPPADAPPSPGKARRYYRITEHGRRALRQETERLQHTLALAERRLGAQEPSA